MISINIVYLFFNEGILGASGRNTCELLTTRKERNEYLFNFYLGMMNLNTFMEFLRSPDSNVDAPLLEHIEAEIAVLRERVKHRRKTTPKQLPSSVKEEVVVVESEVRNLLKKSKNSAPVASGATLRLGGGKTTLPIVGCHFIAESGVVAVYKLKDTDNNFVNLNAFHRLITHHRKDLLGAFGEMFAPWSASKLIIPFERHLHNNFIIPSAVYDELKHLLSTPDMKAKRYFKIFMISNLHQIVGLLNVMQTFYQTTQALWLCLDTFTRVGIKLD